MRKWVFFLIFCSLSIVPSILHSQKEWRRRACLPAAPRRSVAQFAVGNKGYVVCGYEDGPAVSVNEVWQYDPATNKWTQKNNFPTIRFGVSGFVINDTAYFGIGVDQFGTYYNDFYRYDAANDQWIAVANYLGAPRRDAMAFVLNGKGYLACGKNGSQNNDFFEYDPRTNIWTQKANFPGAGRQCGFGFQLGGKGIMGLGSNTSFLLDMYSYDPSADTWTPIASFTNGGRSQVGSISINDTLYSVGGTDGVNLYSDCWRYDQPSNTWVQEQNFSCLGPGRTLSQYSFTINGHAYVACGGNNTTANATTDYNDLLEFGPHDPAFVSRVHILGNDTFYCSSFSQILSTGNPCTVWSTGVIASQITVTTPGTYWAYFSDTCGMVADTINIHVSTSPPQVDLGSDFKVCGNGGATLNARVANAKFIWNDGSTDSFYHVTATGTYSVTATNGCDSASSEVNVSVYPDDCRLLIPTGFSPNGDGVNDVFHATCHCPVSNFSMRVYNRWGQEMYSTSNFRNGWDGIYNNLIQPLGVYVYYIAYMNYCEGKIEQVKGNVTLVK